MSEVGTKNEVQETKVNETEDYKEIKPEGNETTSIGQP